ncbi:hypothetical protein [Laspinema palackyanum]|uniref:hypothetical protein n=1 Tax=Laspinema palackyanum TaxID=3231601 RepID=UPI00345D4796|nr:hypothetical protein [Laspinema sp. D2c]
MLTVEPTKQRTKSCFDCVSCYKWHNETTFEEPEEKKGWDCQHPGVSETEQPLENPDPTYANSCSFFEIFDYKEFQRMNGLIPLNN